MLLVGAWPSRGYNYRQVLGVLLDVIFMAAIKVESQQAPEAAAGHLNECGQPFNPKSIVAMVPQKT